MLVPFRLEPGSGDAVDPSRDVHHSTPSLSPHLGDQHQTRALPLVLSYNTAALNSLRKEDRILYEAYSMTSSLFDFHYMSQ